MGNNNSAGLNLSPLALYSLLGIAKEAIKTLLRVDPGCKFPSLVNERHQGLITLDLQLNLLLKNIGVLADAMHVSNLAQKVKNSAHINA
jgi:hypothetical protein